MTVIDVRQDTAALTLTLTAEFAVTPDRAWQLWSDPRQLERWWGPPTYPATVVDHDLTAGGRVTYFMTSPEGERFHGWWQVIAVDPARRLEFVDGFADADGQVNPDLPTTRAGVTFDAIPGGTRMTVSTQFGSLEQMEQLVAMGMVEGITAAMGQIDAILEH